MKQFALEGYDVIGDVHGMYDHLVALLRELGYGDETGAFRHPKRQAVFVGDLIDRGGRQVETLELVRAMAECGSALVVMGNHEFNAIAYATPHPDQRGAYLRSHDEKNTKQHAEFLGQIGFESSDHRDVIGWFGTLPLWLDLGELRVVHACWDDRAMAGLGSSALVDRDLLIAANDPCADEYTWVEHLCKGPEIQLPRDHSFLDKDGRVRTRARARWWAAGDLTYSTYCEVPLNCQPPLPDDTITNPPVQPYTDPIPVIFGHYWRRWPEFEITATTACVDYSAVHGGPMVAYRWSGETTLTEHHFVASRAPAC